MRCFEQCRKFVRQRIVSVATLFMMFAAIAASAQTLTVLHNFTGGDGSLPQAGPILDRAGNLYGTTYTGGANGVGSVYKLSGHGSSWIYSPLYNFTGGADGGSPAYGALTFGPNGTLYGTASGRLSQIPGAVVNLMPRATACQAVLCYWSETTLHEFGSGNDGVNPEGSIVFDAAGNFYGTTYSGGESGNGTVFKASRSGGGWSESVIYSFAANGSHDGANPVAGPTLDSAGNIYGTTYAGGANGFGCVFELTPSGSGWTENILYSFRNAEDGRFAAGGVILDRAGNLYGATYQGGSSSGGTVYELFPSGGGWTMTILYSFFGAGGPYNNLTFDANGNLYGTTYFGGAFGNGSAFELRPSNGTWTLTDLHDFSDGTDGGFPLGSVALDAAGNVYGTASQAGMFHNGVVFEITP